MMRLKKKKSRKKIVEVSPVQAVAAPVEVTTYTQPIVTPSIIERKTSEDFHSLFPSSPPPTPIDPSPLQQAQQTAANADALAEALKLPAQTIKQSRNDPYIADDQKNSNTIESSNKSAIINQSIVHEEPLNIPGVEKNVPELKECENEKKDHSTILLSAVAPQTDLVIQTEEGPIPLSSSDTEINIESEKNNTDEINAEAIVDIPDIPSEVVEKITNNDHEIMMNEEKIPIDDESRNTKIDDEINSVKIEDDIPPPLPESPVPMPKTTTDLLNFMTSQIEDSQVILNDVIDITSSLSTESVAAAVVLPCAPTISNEISSEIELQNKFCDISESSNIVLPPQDIENLSLPPPPEVAAYEVVQESISPQFESPIESLLTPPRSPSPSLKPNHIVNECASLIINGHDNNTTVDIGKEKNTSSGTILESVKQSHPVTSNDDTIDIIKDRLADTIAKEEETATTMVACPLTQHVENDEQVTNQAKSPFWHEKQN